MTRFLQEQFNFSALLTLALVGLILTVVAYCIYFERKVAAWIQDRKGPNRVGFFGLFGGFHFWGLGQPVADGLKLFLKEDIIPARVDRPIFLIAPVISFIVALVGFAVIPWAGQVRIGERLLDVQVANPSIGLLYILAVGSMGVYGVTLGGWASNSKYSLFGGIRAAAQMLSYEIPMGVALLVVVLTCGELRLEEIVNWQYTHGNVWLIFRQPLAFFLLVITVFAETNRAPFDLAEAEQELVGGFHTEYSSMKFGMFFLGEYAHMITGSAFVAVLFLGGWTVPFLRLPLLRPEDVGVVAALAKFAVLFGKVCLGIFVFMWVRWTLPRFRFDQLMRLAWQGLIPVSLGVLVVTMTGLYFGWHDNILFTLGGNTAVLAVALLVAAGARTPLSGRQAHLPPAGARTGPESGGVLS